MMPALSEGDVLQKEQYPELFKTLLTSLLNIFHGEQIRLQDSGAEAVPRLIQEFVSYTYNREPFQTHPYMRGMTPLKWWMQVSKDSSASLLGVCQKYLLIVFKFI